MFRSWRQKCWMNVVFPAPVIPITAITMSFGLSDVNFGYSDGCAQEDSTYVGA